MSSKRPSVFPVVLAGFTAFLDLYATQPLLPMLMRVFDATHVTVSLTVTAPTLAVAIAAPVVGRVSDVAGLKRVMVASAWLLAVATALASTATGLWSFIAWRFVQGLATPGIFAIAISYIHAEYPAWFAGRASAAYVSGTVTGGFCGRALVGLLAANYGWKPAFAVLAVANVLAALALTLSLPKERRKTVRSPAANDRGTSAAPPQKPSTAGHRRRGLLRAVFPGGDVHLRYVPPRGGPLRSEHGCPRVLFVVYLFGAAVTPVAGRWVDVYGHRAGLAVGMAVARWGRC
ncbi:MAG: MFS transporter [Vicinamibacterales bacterium]